MYFADERGRIVTEMTCLPFSDEDVGVITAAVAQGHDADILRKGLPEGVVLEDWSDKIHCFIVTGPKARDLLAGIAEADLSLPWLSVQYTAKVAGKDVALVRVSFAGELGWEIHCDRGDAAAIYDAVLAGGAKPFGMRALNAIASKRATGRGRATCPPTIRCWKAGWSASSTGPMFSPARRRCRRKSSAG